MLKRLPFALLAISFSVPVVACLNAASSDEATSGDANMLTDADKAACNFGFAETAADPADPTFDPAGAKGVFKSSRSFVFGDATGDHHADLLMVSGKGEVALFPGKGDGHFDAPVKSVLTVPNSSSARALALAGTGDFDGDGLKDFVALQTVFSIQPVASTAGHYVIGYGKADGTFSFVTLPFSIPDGAATRLAKWTAIADLDGDGRDEIVVAGTETEAIYFGEANRKFTLVRSPVKSSGAATLTSDRVLTFASAKTGLVVNNSNHSWKVTFAADRTPTVVDSALAAPNLDMRLATDLDGDDRPELTLFDPGHDKLTINPLGANAPAPTKFVKFPGTIVDDVDFGIDLAHDQKRELIYKTDDRKLFAACGYSATTQEIVGVELPVAYGDKTAVIGTPDLNGDGKPDFATFNFDTKALKVFLAAAPPPTVTQISYYAEGFVPPAVDAGPGDSGPIVVTDAGTDSGPSDDGGPIVVTDAGPHPTDAGADAAPKDAGTKVDAGPKDAGTKVDAGPKTDSGTTPPGDDDDDDTTSGDDDDSSGPVKPKDAGTKPSTKPSSSSSSTSGSVTVTVKDKPAPEDDGGCSTAPGRSSPTGSIGLGAMVALFLLGGRRRRKA
jgi:MYXO-CTERM domain-containing protein